MKKLKKLMLTLLLGLFLIPGWAFGAGTVTQSWNEDQTSTTGVVKLTYTWTADASNGSVPATASERDIDGYVFLVITNPGATAPTDNYDITLTDNDSCDVMGGELANRDTSVSEQAAPGVGSTYGSRYVQGPLTLNLSNNSVNSAVGTTVVYYYKW